MGVRAIGTVDSRQLKVERTRGKRKSSGIKPLLQKAEPNAKEMSAVPVAALFR
jgi:hypothetical protein